MVRRLALAVCCGSVLVTACRHPEPAPPASFISGNDFEGLDGWVPVGPAVTKAQAHSGRYSTTVNTETEFSVSYSNTLEKAGLKAGQELEVSAWAFLVNGQSNASVVAQIVNPANPDEKVFWEALPLAEQVKIYNRWSPVKRTFRLPDTVKPEYELRVYLWRHQATNAAFLDDIVLTKAD